VELENVRLFDADGAMHLSGEELDPSPTTLVLLLANPRDRNFRFESSDTSGDTVSVNSPDMESVSSPRLVFEVRDMSHYGKRFTIMEHESLEAFARRICEWGDLCMLRKWTLARY